MSYNLNVMSWHNEKKFLKIWDEKTRTVVIRIVILRINTFFNFNLSKHFHRILLKKMFFFSFFFSGRLITLFSQKSWPFSVFVSYNIWNHTSGSTDTPMYFSNREFPHRGPGMKIRFFFRLRPPRVLTSFHVFGV